MDAHYRWWYWYTAMLYVLLVRERNKLPRHLGSGCLTRYRYRYILPVSERLKCRTWVEVSKGNHEPVGNYRYNHQIRTVN